MRFFKVTVEYDGTDFAGFQYQAGQRSVQGEIERAIEKLTGQAVRVHGAGRTDTGVHALGQVIGFRADTRIPSEKLAAAMNGTMPRDIRAKGAAEVDESFHARFSAKSRDYVYLILNREHPSALFGRYSAHWPHEVDVESMERAASLLMGTHDFAAWANDLSEAKSSVRTISCCKLRRAGRFILVRVEADGFLRGMVRNIVGTLMEIGGGKRAAGEMELITESKDRAKAGPCAPPQGLCLVRVRY